MLRVLNKPEYLYRPSQLLKRAWYATPLARHGLQVVDVAWGCQIRCNVDEDIGRSLAHFGLYDLVVSETIRRLLDRGETGVDVGANIGYMTALMARGAGPRGRVLSFEPSELVFRNLAHNLSQWRKDHKLAPIVPHQCAVTCAPGEAILHYAREFDGNEGTATLEIGGADRGGRSERVHAVTLDQCFPGSEIALMKVDVEGHELGVFQGASRLLAERRLRDVVFEEHRPYPAPTHQYLEQHRYRIFRLSRSLRRLLLRPPDEVPELTGLPPNYLATINADRAHQRAEASGWMVLSGG